MDNRKKARVFRGFSANIFGARSVSGAGAVQVPITALSTNVLMRINKFTTLNYDSCAVCIAIANLLRVIIVE